MNEPNYWKNKWSNRPPEQANNFAKRAFKLIKDNNFRTLLDLGCGDGRDSIYFSNKRLNVTAVDFSKSGIEKLKARQNKVNCVPKDIRNINFPENSFDVIYTYLILHYFDDKTTNEIFNNLYKILKRGGLIFVKCKSTDDALYGKGKKVGENMYKKGPYPAFLYKGIHDRKTKKV